MRACRALRRAGSHPMRALEVPAVRQVRPDRARPGDHPCRPVPEVPQVRRGPLRHVDPAARPVLAGRSRLVCRRVQRVQPGLARPRVREGRRRPADRRVPGSLRIPLRATKLRWRSWMQQRAWRTPVVHCGTGMSVAGSHLAEGHCGFPTARRRFPRSPAGRRGCTPVSRVLAERAIFLGFDRFSEAPSGNSKSHLNFKGLRRPLARAEPAELH
jgi:hypothetical protein